MWHFVKGVEPPKRKQTTEERKERDVSYEKRHKRGFQSTWQVNRPWLRVENISDEEVLFCDYCIKAGGFISKKLLLLRDVKVFD